MSLNGCARPLPRLNDAVDFFLDFGVRHSEQQTAQPNVLQTRGVIVHPKADIEQRHNFSVTLDGAVRRRVDTGHRAQQSGFPRAVSPNQADTVAAVETKVDVIQRTDDDYAIRVFRDLVAPPHAQNLLFQRATLHVINGQIEGRAF